VLKQRLLPTAFNVANWEITNALDALPLLLAHKGRILYFVEEESDVNPVQRSAGELFRDFSPKSLIFIFNGQFFRTKGALKLLGEPTMFRSLTYMVRSDFDFVEKPTSFIDGWRADLLQRILTEQIKAGAKVKHFKVERVPFKDVPLAELPPVTLNDLKQTFDPTPPEPAGFRNEGEI
jgi:hypothetical protein